LHDAIIAAHQCLIHNVKKRVLVFSTYKRLHHTDSRQVFPQHLIQFIAIFLYAVNNLRPYQRKSMMITIKGTGSGLLLASITTVPSSHYAELLRTVAR
jgi:hypothetical protein